MVEDRPAGGRRKRRPAARPWPNLPPRSPVERGRLPHEDPMDAFAHELRYATRRLLRSPGFTTTVLLTLALGIGANTAIFSVVNTVLLRPLPYREPERLVTIHHYYPNLNELEAPVSAPGFRDYRDKTKSFESVAVETGWSANLTGTGEPERVPASRVSGHYFRVYGVPAQVGRTLQ